MDLFEKIQKEIEEDLKLDRLNLLEKQMMLPAIKHKWVSRLIQNKRHKNQIEENGIPKNLPKIALDKKIESTDSILKIEEQIKETEIIIEYLEKVENICRSLTYDIKNAVELEKLETT
jgi:uncharacterized sporulation protein YeaH/YhbH (DUF444 family)